MAPKMGGSWTLYPQHPRPERFGIAREYVTRGLRRSVYYALCQRAAAPSQAEGIVEPGVREGPPVEPEGVAHSLLIEELFR